MKLNNIPQNPNNWFRKWVEDSNRHFFIEDIPDNKYMERCLMPQVTKEIENENHNEISPQKCQNGYYQKDDR